MKRGLAACQALLLFQWFFPLPPGGDTAAALAVHLALGALEIAGVGGAHPGVEVGDELHRVHIADDGGAGGLVVEQQPGDPHGGEHPLLADDVLGPHQKFHHHVVAHRKGDDLLDGLRVDAARGAVRGDVGVLLGGQGDAVLVFGHRSVPPCQVSL